MTISTETTNIYTHGPASGSPAKQLVILLHGVGANGRDLIDLAGHFEGVLPDAVFVSPDAPHPCDMVPPGYPDSYQWFSLLDRSPEALLSGIQQAAPWLDSFITEQIEKYGVPASKTALIGFSQGTMMSLYVGKRYPEKLAGILGYSGALLWENDTDTGTLQKMPICLIHGDADDVVPVAAYHHAKETLEQAGYNISGGITPGLAHSIDHTGLQTGQVFLKDVLVG
jgi:phospholipase/carboxylesterase